jgi:hypothetical protein
MDGVAKFLTNKIIILPRYPKASDMYIKNPALLLYLKKAIHLSKNRV